MNVQSYLIFPSPMTPRPPSVWECHAQLLKESKVSDTILSSDQNNLLRYASGTYCELGLGPSKSYTNELV